MEELKMIRTLNEINERVEQARKENQREGTYGIDECKKHILWEVKVLHYTLEDLYTKYVVNYMKDFFFNVNMIVAVEELINER